MSKSVNLRNFCTKSGIELCLRTFASMKFENSSQTEPNCGRKQGLVELNWSGN